MDKQEDILKGCMTKRQLAAHYKISIQTISRWIRLHKEEIGELNGYLLTPQQVKKFTEIFGSP